MNRKVFAAALLILLSGAAADGHAKSMPISSSMVPMSGNDINVATLKMTGDAGEAAEITTGALKVTGDAGEAAEITTAALKMTGDAGEASEITTATLRVTGAHVDADNIFVKKPEGRQSAEDEKENDRLSIQAEKLKKRGY